MNRLKITGIAVALAFSGSALAASTDPVCVVTQQGNTLVPEMQSLTTQLATVSNDYTGAINALLRSQSEAQAAYTSASTNLRTVSAAIDGDKNAAAAAQKGLQADLAGFDRTIAADSAALSQIDSGIAQVQAGITRMKADFESSILPLRTARVSAEQRLAGYRSTLAKLPAMNLTKDALAKETTRLNGLISSELSTIAKLNAEQTSRTNAFKSGPLAGMTVQLDQIAQERTRVTMRLAQVDLQKRLAAVRQGAPSPYVQSLVRQPVMKSALELGTAQAKVVEAKARLDAISTGLSDMRTKQREAETAIVATREYLQKIVASCQPGA